MLRDWALYYFKKRLTALLGSYSKLLQQVDHERREALVCSWNSRMRINLYHLI
jgi:hypothetical protein